MLSFSGQAFSIILTPRFQDWHNIHLQGLFRGPLPTCQKRFFPFSAGSPDSFLQERGRVYLISSSTEPDRVFPFPQQPCFNCNGWGISPCCSPAGILIWSPGRQREGGGRDPRDPGLGVAQPHSAHPVCGRGRGHTPAVSSAAVGGTRMISLCFILLLMQCSGAASQGMQGLTGSILWVQKDIGVKYGAGHGKCVACSLQGAARHCAFTLFCHFLWLHQSSPAQLHSSPGSEMMTGCLQGCIVLSSNPLQNHTSLSVTSHFHVPLILLSHPGSLYDSAPTCCCVSPTLHCCTVVPQLCVWQQPSLTSTEHSAC